MENNIGWWLTKRAFLSPEREAYVGDGTGAGAQERERLTFAELNRRSNRVANAFLEAGVAKGERVALLLMNSPEFVEAFFALGKDRRGGGAVELASGRRRVGVHSQG